MTSLEPTECFHGKNTLHLGDNLEIMRDMPSGIVDLCYFDPPFFADHGNQENCNIHDSMSSTGAVGIDAYVEFLEERLEQVQRLLAPGGSLYCHLTKKTTHYVKVILDELLGRESYKNDITFVSNRRENNSGPRIGFSKRSESILFYAAVKNKKQGEKAIFNIQRKERTPEYLRKIYCCDDGDGLGPYAREYPKHGKKRRYLSKATSRKVPDFWDDIRMPNSSEKKGWPDQKPEALLERIILSSSNPGDLVFDPFVGCGTTIRVAKRLKRDWVAIDNSPEAIALASKG